MRKLIRFQIMRSEPIPEDLTIIQIIGEDVVGRKNGRAIIALNVWAIKSSLFKEKDEDE